MSIRVFDFDQTIYTGDCTRDFHRYCLKKYPRVLADLCLSVWWLFGMGLGLVTKTRAKERFYRFLRFVPDIDGAVNAFWAGHMHKIKRWYLECREESDLIISASPEFLLRPAADKLALGLIASRVDAHTGRTDGLNCSGEEKVRRLLEERPDAVISCFYSDSFNDAPLAALSEKAFLVKGDRIRPWPIAK